MFFFVYIHSTLGEGNYTNNSLQYSPKSQKAMGSLNKSILKFLEIPKYHQMKRYDFNTQ